MQTKGKVEMPEGEKKEPEVLFLHSTVSTLRIFKFPLSHYKFRPDTAEIYSYDEPHDGQTEFEICFNWWIIRQEKYNWCIHYHFRWPIPSYAFDLRKEN